jgi:hypothetical protein
LALADGSALRAKRRWVSIVYAFSAMSKVNASFLRGDILQSALRIDDVAMAVPDISAPI